MKDVTRLLLEIEQGEESASDRLLPLVYDELRKLAASRLSNEFPGYTLQATDLVHEAYLRLVEVDRDVSWANRRHFFAAAAEAMRRVVVDDARRRKSLKRGGDLRRAELNENHSATSQQSPVDILALDEALQSLAEEDPVKAELVKLRFLAGLPHQDAARILGISRPTADRYWAYAKAKLFVAMSGDNDTQRLNKT